ncbi:hypothetical protein CAG70_17640 [Photobacterium halotolerans]|uniref:hypothetical protein n=1 Tax=Photobacterium halotolerans TaxID=265726 RepID=UPI0013736270|nr:hypothetical protein [Photobacterium halotolerans]NAX48810.1 hypothetical protein [Photobacterium halotolerans]
MIKIHGKRIRLVFGILIDDLGLQCGNAGCSIQDTTTTETNEIPNELESILTSAKIIKRDRVVLFSERTTKNRAISSLKKRIIQDSKAIRLVYQENIENIKVMMPLNDSGDEILLSNKKEHIFGIKCPGIMGQHYEDVIIKLKERFFQANDFHIIDWSEIMDKTKVSHGARAFTRVFNTHRSSEVQHIQITNIFFADDSGQLVKFNHEISISRDQVVSEMSEGATHDLS